MATVQEVWQDRDFLRLPPTEKQKVMQALDPDFQGLPDAEQKRAIFQLSESKGPVQTETPLMSSHTPSKRVIPEKPYLKRLADPENVKRYGEWLMSPAPSQQEGESAVGRMVQNIPESAFKLPYQAAAGAYQLVKNVTDPLVEGAYGGENTLSKLGGAVAQDAEMVGRGIGEPMGLYGLDRAKERWTTDPVGSAAVVLPLAPEAAKVTVRGAKAAGRGAGVVAETVGSRIGPEGLYNSALKMTTDKKVSVAERSKRAQTGLEGGYMPTEKGYNRLLDDIDSINQQIGETIKGAAGEGKTVAVEDVLKRLEPIKERALNDINPQPILETIASIEENLQNHPLANEGQIPINVAQQMKIETYRGLKKAYNEMKSSEVEARKAVARGLKEEIANLVPEISGLNAKDSALIALEDSLKQATKRIANRDVMGIGGPLKVGAGVLSDLAGAGGAGTLAGIAAWAFDVPQVKSALAIALYRARKSAGNIMPMSKIKAEVSQLVKAAKEKAGATLDGFDGFQLSPGKIGDQSTPVNNTLPVPSGTMRVTPEGQVVPPGASGGSYGTAMTPEQIAAARRNVNAPGPMTKGFTIQGEPYNPDAVTPDQYIPPNRQVALRPQPQPVDAQRPIAGYLPLNQARLPQQTAAIAGENGAVFMPQNTIQMLNPREMTPQEIAAARRKINAKGKSGKRRR